MFVIRSNPSATAMNKPTNIPTKRVLDVETHGRASLREAIEGWLKMSAVGFLSF
ncbi:MAG: hypothetical protein NUV76_09295 [Candidatus Kuenenia sp.]|nr:hypothetical protein [Candidatus Kuenenia sp.]